MTQPSDSMESSTDNSTRYTSQLRNQSAADWSAAVNHRFTRELVNGTIDDDVFARYLIQDYAFIETLVSVVGYAVGQAPTMAAKARLTSFLTVLTSDENDYFQRSFDALNIPTSNWRDPDLAPVTAEFRDFMYAATLRGDYAETLAVLVPVEWIYLTWASNADSRPKPFYLAEWIDLHADVDFEMFVEWLQSELDREGATLSDRQQQRVEELFHRAVELEIRFFNDAYAGSDGE